MLDKSCGCKESILIVDDTELNILVVVSMVKKNYGLDIDIASNGKEAVEMYQLRLRRNCKCPLRPYKLILMDLSMPVMSGQEASI